MDDEGIPGGALLGSEDFGDGFGRESVGAEAVDGFCGEGYGAAFAEDASGLGDIGRGVEMEGGGHFGYGSGFIEQAKALTQSTQREQCFAKVESRVLKGVGLTQSFV